MSIKISDTKLIESLLEKEDEIKRLKRENMNLKEKLLSKFMEGDDTADDTGSSDTPENDSADSEDDKAETMNTNVLKNMNVPKNLVLDDGTETKVAQDSNQGNVDVGQDEDNAYVISYKHGNWDYFTKSAKDFSEKVTTIRQTITPLLEKALIELIGNSGAYDRSAFNATAGLEDDKFRVSAEFHYQVNLYIVSDDDDKAKVMHDQGYIYQTLSQVPGINISSTKIDTDTGDVTVIVSI